MKNLNSGGNVEGGGEMKTFLPGFMIFSAQFYDEN